jgi:hypothetical protein
MSKGFKHSLKLQTKKYVIFSKNAAKPKIWPKIQPWPYQSSWNVNALPQRPYNIIESLALPLPLVLSMCQAQDCYLSPVQLVLTYIELQLTNMLWFCFDYALIMLWLCFDFALIMSYYALIMSYYALIMSYYALNMLIMNMPYCSRTPWWAKAKARHNQHKGGQMRSSNYRCEGRNKVGELRGDFGSIW